jgi:toxin ParE1/3/4
MCDDIRPGYCKYQVGRHLIFYRQVSDGLEIVRVLHDRMDVETHFNDE